MGKEGFTLSGRRLGPAFDRWSVTIPPGRVRRYDPVEWRDALILVERGEVHLECRAGRFRAFPAGAVLCLVGLPLRALHNRGSEPVVLVAVRRAGG